MHRIYDLFFKWTLAKARNDALEEAAKYCDSRVEEFNEFDRQEDADPNPASKDRKHLNSICRGSYMVAAAEIRNMKG